MKEVQNYNGEVKNALAEIVSMNLRVFRQIWTNGIDIARPRHCINGQGTPVGATLSKSKRRNLSFRIIFGYKRP